MLKPDAIHDGTAAPAESERPGPTEVTPRPAPHGAAASAAAGVPGTYGTSGTSKASDAFRTSEAFGASSTAVVVNTPSQAAGPIYDHAWIARHIPHAGAMCMLDSVIEYDAAHIVCVATSHRRADHPLRAHGRLSAVMAIEYAAQAMAAHGAAIAGRDAPPRAGFLTAVRGVRYAVDRLDTLPGELRCEATRLSGDARTILYAFEVSAGGQPVASGRATVMLDAGAVPDGALPDDSDDARS